MPRLLPILLIPFLLGGCALPVQFQIASFALDGFLYLTTEKSLTDHGISKVTGKDCALHRVVTRDGDICDEVLSGDTAVALAPPAKNQIETKSWQNDRGAPLPVFESPKDDVTEVVDLWSNEVPKHLLPDGYAEAIVQVDRRKTDYVPEIPSLRDVPDLAPATPEVVDFWSSEVPDELLSDVVELDGDGELYLAEINHLY